MMFTPNDSHFYKACQQFFFRSYSLEVLKLESGGTFLKDKMETLHMKEQWHHVLQSVSLRKSVDDSSFLISVA